MTLSEILTGTQNLVAAIGDSVDDLSVDRTHKNLAAAGCLHISLEHHASIAMLTREMHRGSAAALVRPQLESFLRGAWLHRSASEQAVDAFLKDVSPPSPGDMIEALEQHDFYKSGSLSALKAKAWNGLCSYTHAGGLHVTCRLSATEIVQNYDQEELIEMLELSNLVALIATCEIAEIARNDSICSPIYAAYRAIQGHP